MEYSEAVRRSTDQIAAQREQAQNDASEASMSLYQQAQETANAVVEQGHSMLETTEATVGASGGAYGVGKLAYNFYKKRRANRAGGDGEGDDAAGDAEGGVDAAADAGADVTAAAEGGGASFGEILAAGFGGAGADAAGLAALLPGIGAGLAAVGLAVDIGDALYKLFHHTHTSAPTVQATVAPVSQSVQSGFTTALPSTDAVAQQAATTASAY